MPFSLDKTRFTCLLLRRCGVSEDCRFIHLYANIVGNLQNNNIVVNLLYFAINATACDNLLTGLQTFAEIVYLLLTFLLRANHQEVEDKNHCDEEEPLVSEYRLRPTARRRLL